nr:glutaredoxin family protein [Neobacillus sp. Marseille-Q6967]
MQKQVIVYTTNDCIECTMVKKVLEEEGIAFEIRNVAADPEFQKQVEEYGFLGVPVTVAGSHVVKGFNNELKTIIDFAKSTINNEEKS